MEIHLRKHLKLCNDKSIKEALTGIVNNKEVLFYWTMVAFNWDESESSELLNWIAQQWITVQGFSYTSAFIENFKQTQKKKTQKSKALCKTLITTFLTPEEQSKCIHIIQM